VASATPLLEVRDLRVRIRTRGGTVQPLRGVSLTLAPGERLGVVGETGSGKSVLCRSILRLLPPARTRTEGEVRLNGRDLVGLSERELERVRGREASMILQDPLTALNPVLSVFRQIAEPLALHRGLAGRALRERVVAALREVGIADPERVMASFPHQLSGGMRQRVLIAAAIASGPRLLLADEPTTALDVTVQSQILRLIHRLSEEHAMALVLVSHNLGVIAQTCQRIVVMYAGQVMESGPTAAVLATPRHPYTIGLMRSVPRVDRDSETELPGIAGLPPDLHDPPAGCPFRARCPVAIDACAEADAAHLPTPAPDGRVTTCIRADELEGVGE
jgi:oligopeptide/dipeptide ABC transporter ATP-binding protein